MTLKAKTEMVIKNNLIEKKQYMQLSTFLNLKILLMFLFTDVFLVVYLFGSNNIHYNVQQFYSAIYNNKIFNQLRSNNITTRKNKNILMWNGAHIEDTAPFGFGHEPFIRHGCEISTCVVFDDPSSLPFEEYDAILVHMHEISKTHMPYFQRQKHQRFVFLTQESPISMDTIDVTTMRDVFNWTMSYKLNSDIPFLYGRVLPGPTAPKTLGEAHKMIEETHLRSAKNYAANKSHPVVWMASHCPTKHLREEYVRQLSNYIPVDVYGQCGNLSCPHSSRSNFLSDPKCYQMMEQKYKFYLSFENSICTDYVTEKFFEIMNRDMVPVVYGGANYSQIAPLHSYINAFDFTPEKLAQYLKKLDENDSLYNEYFWWKDHYRVEAGIDQRASHGFCDLCKKLHQDEGVIKSYPELVSEWHPKTQCSLQSWQ
jgi:alpha-1,3-fucosyltransferase